MSETESVGAYRAVRWNIALIFRDAAAKGWTMRRLSEESGVCQQTLLNLKTIGRPTPTTMAKIAKALRTTTVRYIIDA